MSHSPALAEKRREASARGGQNKAKVRRVQKLLPPDLQVLDSVLANAIAGVYRDDLSPAQGSAIAALAGARIRVRECALKLAEQSELRERIERLEAAFAQQNARTNGHTRRWAY